MPAPASAGAAAPAYHLDAAQQLFAGTALAEPPPGRGASWLLVAEARGADPLAGEAGQLLLQMLGAMGLQQHPRLFWVGVRRGAPAEGDAGAPLAQLLAELQPTVVLAMGRLAASALLGSGAPLGQLRGQVHQCHGVPLVVSFDPSYLLRAPADKAGAWADLCLALELVQGAT